MPKITEEERQRFHQILDDSIDKLNSEKNIKKVHWKHCSIQYLKNRKIQEKKELREALIKKFGDIKIKSECYDNINFNLFIIDNLNRRTINKKERQMIIKNAIKKLDKK
jgi:hypothetical protein